MSDDTIIRATLRGVADGAAPPSIDRQGFERRVRRYRNRRRAGLCAVAGAMALILAAVPIVVDRIGAGTDSPSATAAPPELTKPVYFAEQRGGGRGHVVAIDPEGELHDLGVRAEEIYGATYDGVIMRGTQSQLVRIRATAGPDGQWRFEQVPAPVDGAIGGAKPSDDGTQLLVLPLRGQPVVYDLTTNDVVRRLDLRPEPIGVDDFTGQRVLYTAGRSTWLDTGDGDPIELPEAMMPSSVGGDFVLVPRIGDVHLYDISSGSAQDVGAADAYIGQLSPDGRYYFAFSDEPAGPPGIWEPGADESMPLSGAGERIWDAWWLDADTALVGSAVERNGQTLATLLVCEAESRACREIHATSKDIWLHF
jgi:hypothetical protein